MIIYEDGQVYEVDCVIYEPFPEPVEDCSDDIIEDEKKNKTLGRSR